MEIENLVDKPLIRELAQEALSTIKKEKPDFPITLENVISFLIIEHRKENEKQVRELLSQRQGRRRGVLPDLRVLIENVVKTNT